MLGWNRRISIAFTNVSLWPDPGASRFPAKNRARIDERETIHPRRSDGIRGRIRGAGPEEEARAGKIWIEHGALQFRECVAEDVKPGEVTSFPQSVQLKRGETVFFSYIVFRSRAQRDRVNAKVMKDPRLEAMMEAGQMPFDAKRMIYGGFEVLVDL